MRALRREEAADPGTVDPGPADASLAGPGEVGARDPAADLWAGLEPASPVDPQRGALDLVRRAGAGLREREAVARRMAAQAREHVRQAGLEVEAALAHAAGAEERAGEAAALARSADERATGAEERARLAEARAVAAEERAREAFRWVVAVHDAIGQRPVPPRARTAPRPVLPAAG